MDSSFTLLEPKLVGEIVSVIRKVAELCATGPIFDAYGPAYVIIPGSIGIVTALICFSFSEGMYDCINFLLVPLFYVLIIYHNSNAMQSIIRFSYPSAFLEGSQPAHCSHRQSHVSDTGSTSAAALQQASPAQPADWAA